MTTGAWVVLAAVALAAAIGVARLLGDGRFRGTRRVEAAETTEEHPIQGLLDGTPWAADLGDQATLLQFSSAFCAPCRATRRVLGEVSELVPGVRHLEVDAEHHLDLVRRLGILRTPTTIVLDADGREVSRAAGAPSRDQVLAALGAAKDAS